MISPLSITIGIDWNLPLGRNLGRWASATIALHNCQALTIIHCKQVKSLLSLRFKSWLVGCIAKDLRTQQNKSFQQTLCWFCIICFFWNEKKSFLIQNLQFEIWMQLEIIWNLLTMAFVFLVAFYLLRDSNVGPPSRDNV